MFKLFKIAISFLNKAMKIVLLASKGNFAYIAFFAKMFINTAFINLVKLCLNLYQSLNLNLNFLFKFQKN